MKQISSRRISSITIKNCYRFLFSKILKKEALVFKTHTYRFSGSRDEVREQTLNKAFLHVLLLTERTAVPIRNCRDFIHKE